MFGIREGVSFQDTMEVYRVNSDGEFTEKLFETNKNPSILQKIKCKLGLYKYANDILMNEGLVAIAAWISSEFDYMGVGTSNSNPSTTTYHDLVAPTLSRVAVTKSIDTTYITGDTALFSGVFTAATTTDLYEAGIFKLSETGVTDVMLCRQTYTKYTVAAGESIGIIWKVICARG